VDQIALVDILPAPQPRPAHPTAVPRYTTFFGKSLTGA
jgi:hypothetical protein